MNLTSFSTGFTTPPLPAFRKGLTRHSTAKSKPLRNTSIPQIPDSNSDDSSAEAADVTGQPSFDDLEYTPEQQVEDSVPEEMAADTEPEELLMGWGVPKINYYWSATHCSLAFQTYTTPILSTCRQLLIVSNISRTMSGWIKVLLISGLHTCGSLCHIPRGGSFQAHSSLLGVTLIPESSTRRLITSAIYLQTFHPVGPVAPYKPWSTS
jgi:hypothetical protein